LIYGPGWANGLGLLVLMGYTLARAWPALLQWRQLRSDIEP
jgi:hypothetical protein